ncbi:MAG: ABC transporter ATP-binding protein [Candidatus Bathyarchaeota archaeon]|nr:ABC transporter ATP-binding protein [Candidatus Bathyarchaeota archaeon]
MSPAIETVQLEKEYGAGQLSVHALRNINLQLSKGEFTAILGASGSGKTTLLNILGTLDRPTSGKVLIDGKDLASLNEKGLVKLRREKIGFIFQFYNLMPVLTAFENVELPMIISGVPKKEAQKRADELLAAVGLQDRASPRPDELSGGQQQRVAVARALANKPTVILADEPTGDLDSATGEQVLNLLLQLSKKQGTTVLAATHDISILKLADRAVRMKDGQIVSDEKLR